MATGEREEETGMEHAKSRTCVVLEEEQEACGKQAKEQPADPDAEFADDKRLVTCAAGWRKFCILDAAVFGAVGV